MHFTVNYLAVVVAAVAAWILGALWYSPALFARQWMSANQYTPEKLEAMKKGMARSYSISLVCFAVLAWVMAVLIDRVGVAGGVLSGVKVGGITWLGFAATIGLTANLYSDKPFAAFVIDAGYQLVYMLAMGVILCLWR